MNKFKRISTITAELLLAILLGCIMTIIPASVFCFIGKTVYFIAALIWIEYTMINKDKENK